jgi:hypothetical protein
MEHAYRSQPLALDGTSLKARVAGHQPIELELFSGEGLLRFEPVDVRFSPSGNMSLRGQVSGEPGGIVHFVTEGRAMAGSISWGDRRYLIIGDEEGNATLHDINVDLFPDDLWDAERPEPLHRPGPSELGKASGRSTIDILVVFTSGAKSRVGGGKALKALVRLGIEETNTALERSNIEARINLRAIRRVGYQETNLLTDVEALIEGRGALGRAHVLRDRKGADLVVLIVDSVDPTGCGRGSLLQQEEGNPGAAFSVVRWDCVSPNYSLAHEIGHNLGLAHENGDQPAGVFPESYGFHAPDHAFRTIMSVPTPGCGPRTLNFSNPDVRLMGKKTGLEGVADASTTIDWIAPMVAGYRGD